MTNVGYFFRPRITRIAPETNAKALDALPALISGTAVKSAKAKLETPTRIKNIPTALSIRFSSVFLFALQRAMLAVISLG
jgi:hypothetical protein